MFSKTVIGSAKFLKMPVDSQNLYFHLGLEADDDGVVEAWSVLKKVGSAEDNLKVLASKGFVKILNEDLVSYILDWNEHNIIRADRLSPSIYRELLVQMLPEIELTQPRERADRPALPMGRPRDNHGTAQDRIGEVSINTPAPLRVADLPSKEEPEIREVAVNDDGDEKRPKAREDSAKYDEMVRWLEKQTGVKVVNRVKQYAHLKKARTAGILPKRLKDRALELLDEPFYREKGMDWGSVVSSFDRRA